MGNKDDAILVPMSMNIKEAIATSDRVQIKGTLLTRIGDYEVQGYLMNKKV